MWAYAAKLQADRAVAADPKALRHEVHNVLRQANYDLGKHQFNTVASAAMKILNVLEKSPSREGTSILLRLLSPVTPHIAHALWRELEFGEDIMSAPWPETDPAALEQDEVELVVQVNGKLRGSIVVPKQADKSAIEKLAMSNPNVQRFVAGQNVKKVVVVPGRLVNLVV